MKAIKYQGKAFFLTCNRGGQIELGTTRDNLDKLLGISRESYRLTCEQEFVGDAFLNSLRGLLALSIFQVAKSGRFFFGSTVCSDSCSEYAGKRVGRC